MTDLLPERPREVSLVSDHAPAESEPARSHGARTRDASPIYWYPPGQSDPERIDVLGALRGYVLAETEMRKRARRTLAMNETDLAALHCLIHARVARETLGAKDLAVVLDISPASVSVMLERLERSGYVTRTVHPTDRRASVIEVTDVGAAEVESVLGPLHARMVAVAESMPLEDAGAVLRFLSAMREAVDVDETPGV